MNKSVCVKKRLYILLFAISTALILPIFFGFTPYSAEQVERNALTVRYRNAEFCYYDDLIAPTDHLVAEELHENFVNAAPNKKSAYVRSLVKRGFPKKKALLAAYPRLERFFGEIAKAVYSDKTDSTIKFRPDCDEKFVITPEADGVAADETRFYAQVYEAWQICSKAEIYLMTQKISPEVTSKDNKSLTYLRGSFSTDYSRSADARKNNVALALKKINGVVIKQGEQFSFNATVGNRTKSNGYETSKIIVGGKYVDGVGGGVCQVSTTLYNAALLSGADIDEANGHSLPPSYVEPSFDAMVNSGSCDLKFSNNTGGDLFIRTTCDGKTATVEFYGKENPYRIVRKSEIIRRDEVPEDEIIIDYEGKYFSPEDESGTLTRVKTGLAGFESESYLLYYRKGTLVCTRRIRRDKYLPIRGILAKKP